MANPIWYTSPGLLGVFSSGTSLLFQLSAAPSPPGTSLTFSIVAGQLPSGLTLTTSGAITGSTTLISTNSFTVQAIDNLGNYQNRSFTIDIVPPQPIWVTPTDIGSFGSSVPLSYQLSATPIQPATSITYTKISGQLPPGVLLDSSGLLYGTPDPVYVNTSYKIVVRATDNVGRIADRTFTIGITSVDAPYFITPSGSLLVTNDTTWVELPVEYALPISDSTAIVEVVQGALPPGLEMNEYGIIRGYADPPYIRVNLGTVVTSVITTVDNVMTCYSTSGFVVNRPIVFSGTVIGGVIAGQTYYVRTVSTDGVSFTISTTAGGPEVELANQVGYMIATLPDVSNGEPTIRTHDFTVKLISQYGTALQSYSITVINQNTPATKGGPGKPSNTRTPTILNTRPATYNILANDLDYSFYILPPNSIGETYPPSTPAYIGRITSNNIFNFQILGKDFDDNELEYLFADLPLGLSGDSTTGWITGNPVIADNSISSFSFSVAARKVVNPSIITPFFNFSFKIRNGIDGDILWITPENMGSVYNGTTSILSVKAESDVELSYSLVSGSLPPNLTLLPSGELSGVVSFQPGSEIVSAGGTTEFTFTIKAFSTKFSTVFSERTFTIGVYQLFQFPTDILYIKCSPSIEDRQLLRTLLTNESLIPNEYLYRSDDPYFGKSTSIIYEHAYGIYASNFEDYVAAITKNHYWRQITLGEIKTAVARDQQTGEVVYEVVYSSVVDNLINPQGVSVSKEVDWPRLIPLELGPWYTSETDLFTSYVEAPNGQQFYTSLTPGFATTLYPNSLPNMREQVGDVLGQEANTNLLPLWMTSQQADGNTTGFIPAWVICYTKPGYAEIIKNNILNDWKNPVGQIQRLNQINFTIDRFTVNKSTTFDYDNNLTPPTWTSLPSGQPVPDPIDSKDFYVLFPRKTILPDRTEYNN